MLQRIALLAIAAPRWVIAVGALVMLAAGIFGVPVAKSLSSSGFQDPTSESARATQLLTDKFHQGDMQMLITVTAPDSATGPAARAVGLAIVDQLRQSPNVADVTSVWTAPPAAAKRLVSNDGKAGLVVAGISGGESAAQKTAKTLSDEEIASALRAVPSMKQQVISRATEVLTEALGAGHESTALKLSKRLSNDAALTKLLK